MKPNFKIQIKKEKHLGQYAHIEAFPCHWIPASDLAGAERYGVTPIPTPPRPNNSLYSQDPNFILFYTKPLLNFKPIKRKVVDRSPQSAIMASATAPKPSVPYRQIRADFDNETMTVYQAYSASIATKAVHNRN